MLEKVSGNYKFEKLRMLLLLEADFNTLRKINFNSKLNDITKTKIKTTK